VKVRCSSLDRLFACPASAHTENDTVLIDHEPTEATKTGIAVHALMADVVKNHYRELPDVKPYAEAYGADEKDVRILGYQGMKFLREYRKFLSEFPLVEVQLGTKIAEGVELTGRPDVLDFVSPEGGEPTVYVIDWKTGEKDEDSRYIRQMQGYAELGVQHFIGQTPHRVVVILAWLRSAEASVISYSLAMLGILREIELAVTRWDGKTFTPGEACRYCPRVAACPGRRDLMLAAVEVLTSERRADLVPFNGQLVDPAGFGRSIVQARFLKQLCEEHLRMATDAVKSMGGDIPMPSGQHIKLVSRAGRPSLKPERVLPYLRERFGQITDDELAAMVSLGKSDVESFVASKAERGEKAQLKEAVFTELEQTGAMTRGHAVEYVQVEEA